MAKNNRIVIPCRFAYLNCWKPGNVYGGSAYSLVALINKNDAETVEKIQSAVEYAKTKSIDKWGGQIPAYCRHPLHDGDADKPDNPIFRNHYYINAKCKDAPQIVDQNVEPILNHSEVYSGCYGNVSLIFYGYNCGGNKGVGAWLCNIQKVKDGPNFNGKIAAKDEFKPVSYEEVLS